MLNSQFEYLKPVNSITLAAGHGGGDSGAVSGSDIEAQDNIYITRRIFDNLKSLGIEVNLVPDELNLAEEIAYVNSKFQWGQTWVIEIHRDSASGISSEVADNCVGVYGFGQYTGQDGNFYNEDVRSMNIARFMRDKMMQLGANASSWARPDSSSRFGRLGWIRDTNPAAHLIELGFVQGSYSPEHLNWLADIATTAIYEAFTGKTAPKLGGTSNLNNNTLPSNNMPIVDQIAVSIFNNYNDLPLDINNLKDLWVIHRDQALDQILASFRKNITEFKISSLQKDQWIAQRDQAIINLQNNSTNSTPQIEQIKQDLAISNQQKDNYRQQLANLVTAYDQLQLENANLKKGISPTSATLNSVNAKSNVTTLSSVISNPNAQVNNLPQTNQGVTNIINASNKPFWQSKKFGANLLNTISSVALITWQTAQIKPEDSITVITTKLGTALAGVLGISFVSNQYIQAQGKVDVASFGGIAGTVASNIVQQLLGGKNSN